MKIVQIVLLGLLLCSGRAFAEDPEQKHPLEELEMDAFGLAVGKMGVGTLGYRPKAHWPRYPSSKTVPYVMPYFDDLLANPRDTYMFTRTLGNAVEDMLTPELLVAAPKDKQRGTETLYKLGVMLATERRIGGFRVFGMDTSPLAKKPLAAPKLAQALGTLLTASGSTPAAEVNVDTIPAELRPALAQLVVDLITARRLIDRGLRHVTPAQRRAVFATLPHLASSTPDGERYFPVIDDVAKVIDEHSLHHGCLTALQAVQNARRSLATVYEEDNEWPDFELRLKTGWGTVLIDNTGVNTQHCDEPFLIVRIGSPNSLDGPVGATSPDRPLSVALLIDGEGRMGSNYGTDVQDDDEARAEVASGVLGCGIVYTAGTKSNYYKTGHWGLGAGLFGLGALIDEGGDDEYRMASVGQGAAFFGAGLLLDAAGDDTYHLAEGDGQGFGGPGGIGILADRSGDDHYYVEPDAKKAGRADYHSKDKIAVSNAQGCGSGRRGDISDGHVWAGGLGALIDIDGNDRYEAGNFSQGLGYWFGTGLLYDGAGDDVFRSVYFTQGSGAHFAIGALIDESGNDRHELWDTAGAALGFGWDVVNAFLIDRGTGNDFYEAKLISMGVAEVRSNAFFFDEGGDDTYITAPKGKFLGDVDDRKSYKQPGRTSDFPWRLSQVAVFLDLGGKDTYQARAADGTLGPHPTAKNDSVWHLRTLSKEDHVALFRGKGHSLGAPNRSYAQDRPDGFLGFLSAFPARKPPAARKPDKEPGGKPAKKALEKR